MENTINKEIANFFYDQVCGQHNGHMAMIPNNPTLHGLMAAYEVKNEDDFAKFCRAIANSLEGK